MIRIVYILLMFVQFDFLLSSEYFDSSIIKYPINNKSIAANQKSDIILTSSINPEKYIVGPGDKFFLSVISNNITINEYLVVSPLGDLILPNLALINVDKLNITSTFSLIKDMYSDKFNNIEFSMTLTDIRKFKIQIMGLKNSPLYIVANPLNKVSDIYNIIKSKNISNINNDNISKRNILLYRNDKMRLIDLLHVKTIDSTYNPFLQENDKIYIQEKSQEVYIEGGINYKGSYEYREGESLFNFINLIGGLSYDANKDNIKISRFTSDSQEIEIIIDNYLDTKSFILQPHDYINVQFKKSYKMRNFVRIEGEVNTPGLYVLNDGMTIQDLLLKAGGYTSNADTNKILINNKNFINARDPEYERIELIPPQNRTVSEISYLKSRKIAAKDFVISENNDITKKIIQYKLNTNDVINVPKIIKFVEIIGGVNNPGLYPYSSNMTVSDLIDLSGGRSKVSTRKVYIINSLNQKNRVRNLNSLLNNGDIVFIQTKQDFNLWNKFQESMGLMGQIATLIAVIQSAQNN